MIESRQSLSVSRILIALDTSGHDNHVLDTAVQLAANRGVELVTLFIEDQDLVHLAEFPFAREIERGSGAERKLDSLRMTRALRSEAQRVSRRLKDITRQIHVRYSLKTVRGSYMAEAMAAVTGTDILFLSRSMGVFRRHATVGRRSLLTRPPSRPGHSGNVWVWYQSSPSSEAALAVAAEIAGVNRRLVLLCSDTANDELLEQLRQRHAGIDYTVMSAVEQERLVDLICADRSGLLVVHAGDLAEGGRISSKFLEELGYPVAVVF
jgi:hypothetical protein